MKLKDKSNEKFVKYFFENHRVFFSNDFPWKLFNAENSKSQKDTNLHTRIEYLFSKNGFFNETYKERDLKYIEQERKKRLDYCFYHRQRRYITQELIDDNFHNPTHHSFITSANRENLSFDFLSPKYFHMEDRGFKNGTKYHKQTKCNILKLWELNDTSTIDKSIHKIKGDNLLHSRWYIDEFFNSSKQIAEIMFEKKLTIYTDTKDDVGLHFNLIRKRLIRSAELLMKKRKDSNFYFDKISKFTFDVVVVDKKPKNISELNGNKGFAIWIDKSVLNDINREIYEFTFFTRKDVKSAETEDGKISITNCRNTGNKKWKINKEFYS